MSASPVVIKENTPRSVQALVSPLPEKRDTDVAATRMIGGAANYNTQSAQVEDDGEGWVGADNMGTAMAGFGLTLDSSLRSTGGAAKSEGGPATELRCACATTDFAMQNVLLQMGMPLLSVDGVAITRTKVRE